MAVDRASLFKNLKLRINAFLNPAFVNGAQVLLGFGHLSPVAGFCNPVLE